MSKLIFLCYILHNNYFTHASNKIFFSVYTSSNYISKQNNSTRSLLSVSI